MADPPPQPRMVEVFQLNTVTIPQTIPSVGTLAAVLKDIKAGVVQRANKERENHEKAKLLGPSMVKEKPVLPQSDDNFVVRVTNTSGQTVCYMFKWKNLYHTGFYVEAELEAERCWYLYSDHKHTILPPAHQFRYDPVIGRGIFILPVSSAYAGLGRKAIKLGQEAVESYVTHLFTIRNHMHRSGSKMQKLILDKAYEHELAKGPFSFGAVVISEPSRFLDYHNFMLANIFMPNDVPTIYTEFFTHWRSLSTAVKSGKGYELIIDGVKVQLTAEQVLSKIRILCSAVTKG